MRTLRKIIKELNEKLGHGFPFSHQTHGSRLLDVIGVPYTANLIGHIPVVLKEHIKENSGLKPATNDEILASGKEK